MSTKKVMKISDKDRFDMLFQEYQLGVEHTKRYGNYTFSIMTVLMAGIGALFFWVLNAETEQSYLVASTYALPFFIYICSLLYMSNEYKTAKVEGYLIHLEGELKKINSEFVGWNSTHMYGKGMWPLVLPYAPMFLLMIIGPIAFILMGNDFALYSLESETPIYSHDIFFLVPVYIYFLFFLCSLSLIIMNLTERKGRGKSKNEKKDEQQNEATEKNDKEDEQQSEATEKSKNRKK